MIQRIGLGIPNCLNLYSWSRPCCLDHPLLGRVHVDWQQIAMGASIVVSIICFLQTFLSIYSPIFALFGVASYLGLRNTLQNLITVEEFRMSVSSLKQTNIELRQTKDKIEAVAADLRLENGKFSASNKQLKETSDALQTVAGSLTTEVGQLKDENGKLKIYTASLKDEVLQLGIENGKLKVTSDELRKSSTNFALNNVALAMQIAKIRTASEGLHSGVHDLREENAKLRELAGMTAVKIETFDKRAHLMGDKFDTNLTDLGKQVGAIKLLNRAVFLHLKQQQDLLSGQKQELQKKLDRFELFLGDLQKNNQFIAERMEVHKKTEELRAKSQQELHDIQVEFAATQSANKSETKHLKKVRKELQKVQGELQATNNELAANVVALSKVKQEFLDHFSKQNNSEKV